MKYYFFCALIILSSCGKSTSTTDQALQQTISYLQSDEFNKSLYEDSKSDLKPLEIKNAAQQYQYQPFCSQEKFQGKKNAESKTKVILECIQKHLEDNSKKYYIKKIVELDAKKLIAENKYEQVLQDIFKVTPLIKSSHAALDVMNFVKEQREVLESMNSKRIQLLLKYQELLLESATAYVNYFKQISLQDKIKYGQINDENFSKLELKLYEKSKEYTVLFKQGEYRDLVANPNSIDVRAKRDLVFPFGIWAFTHKLDLTKEEIPPIKKGRSPIEITDFIGFEFGNLILSMSSYMRTTKREIDSERTISDYKDKNYKAHGDAVKVVFLDDGFTFDTVPELLTFRDEAPFFDAADLDDNPFYVHESMSYTSHGTQTSGAYLTLLSRIAPKLLKEKRLDLGFVKTFPNYAVVGSKDFKFADKFSLEKTIEKIEGQADIVSISMGFLQKSKMPSFNFLAVVAAGNNGEQAEVEQGGIRGCLQFSKEQERENILCVGAIDERVLLDQVAPYSTFGEGVDLYTYESFNKICKLGTSCAAPAISVAATIIKAKYPSLNAKELKRSIVKASSLKLIGIREHKKLQRLNPEKESIKLPFFDPVTMMDEALKQAKLIIDQRKGSK